MNFTAKRTLPFHFLFHTIVVTIGFNGTYSVREDAGGVSIFVFASMNNLTRDVMVTLSTLDNTAGGGFAQCLTCMKY